MSHTKGPWAASEHGAYGDYDGNSIVILGDDLRIAVVLGYDTKETRANARLIAAAPELLEALEAMIEWDAREEDHAIGFYDRMDLCKLAFEKARGAVAKAKGE
jgi:hypothetical protein